MNSQSNQTNYDDEIDLKELFLIIWNGKLLISLVVIICLMCSIFYLRGEEQKHSVTIVYKQVSEAGSTKSFGNLGGLASLAGVSLPSSSNSDFDAFIHLMTSEEVAEIIYQNTKLMKKIYIGEFDEVSNVFKVPTSSFLGSLKKNIKSFMTGTDIEVYRPPGSRRLTLTLKNSFTTSVDKNTGFLILSANTSRPDTLIELMENAISVSDILLKNRYIKNSSQSLNFYQQKIVRAKSREHREVLAKLIGEEEKKLMLASRSENFVVEPISRAEISLYPTSPKVSLVLALSIIMGIFCGVGLLLILNVLKKTKVEI